MASPRSRSGGLRPRGRPRAVARGGPCPAPLRRARPWRASYALYSRFRAEILAQKHPRPVKLPLRRAARNVEHRRDLTVLVPLDVVQHENLARAGRQLLDAVLEIDGEIGAHRL